MVMLPEWDRYDRQERVSQIGRTGQQKIWQATILLVGAGALGTYCAELLARAGVRRLLVFDPDTVSWTNLQRQTLFTEADVQTACFKVDALNAAIKRINSQVMVRTFPYELSKTRFLQLPPFDLAIDCTDNYQVRDLLNQLALKYHFDYIYGACAGVSGNVMAISPTKGPCLHCLFPNLEQLKQTDCDLLGVNTALVPIVSGLQVSLALKYLVDKSQVNFQQFLTVNNWTLQQDSFTVLKNPNCPACHGEVQVTEDFKNQLKMLCGTNVYAIYLEDKWPLQTVKNFLTHQQITFNANPICLQFQWQGLALSLFKNQKLLIYQAQTKRQAVAAYQAFTQQLQEADYA